MQVTPYLFFDGRCEEAVEFYKKTLGAEVGMLMRFKDAPAGSDKPGDGCAGPMPSGDKVMHCAMTIGDTVVMASDGNALGKPDFKGFSLSLNAKDDTDAKRLFGALSEGGTVTQPLIPTFFASSFGMVTDKFGLGWMVIAENK